MADFNKAIEILKEIEGGYSNRKSDKGNKNSKRELVGTNYGISAPTYEKIIGRPPTEADMKNITYEEARDIYKKQYWDAIRGDEIKDQWIANIFFDGVVNQSKSIKWMQKAVGVKADGRVGPQTIEAINQADPLKLHDDFKEKRKSGYENYIKADPKQEENRKGWMNRLDKHKYPQDKHKSPSAPQQFDLAEFSKTLNEISSKIEQLQRNVPS